MTFPAGRTSLGKTTGLKTTDTCREVFIKGTKSTVATSAAARLQSVGLGEAFTGLGQQWQALFGRKPFPSLAGPHGPSAHIASPRLGQAWHAALLPSTARLGVLPHASPRSSAGQLGGGT